MLHYISGFLIGIAATLSIINNTLGNHDEIKAGLECVKIMESKNAENK